MRHNREQIYTKGFKIAAPTREQNIEEFSSIRIGLKTLEDAVLTKGPMSKNARPKFQKEEIQKALQKGDLSALIEISDYFYRTDGMYRRLCDYLAKLYRHDWYIEPCFDGAPSDSHFEKDFKRALSYLDCSNLKYNFDYICNEVIKHGSYYAYLIDCGNRFVFQQLPSTYCRSRFRSGELPVVEFNVKYFNQFVDTEYRNRILSMFPKEIQTAYILLKKSKLPKDTVDDDDGWVVLTTGAAFRFALDDTELPILVDIIPSLIDLDDAQELDRKKTAQKLLKILIQKLPRDKNGDLIFDVDEARDLHNSAVSMLRRAVGVDVLTTFADVEMADMRDTNSTTSKDDLEKVERTVYNNAGIPGNLFNTEGNLALEKSVLNDEAFVRGLNQQFEILLNCILLKFKHSKYRFIAHILDTTIHNYKDLAKAYLDLTKVGYSKMLPWIALGNSQSSMLSLLPFEINYLELDKIMIPPQSSNTTSGNSTSSSDTGRPAKNDDELSEKTIQNRESQS